MAWCDLIMKTVILSTFKATADERMLAYRAVRTLDARREAGVVLKWRRKSVVM